MVPGGNLREGVPDPQMADQDRRSAKLMGSATAVLEERLSQVRFANHAVARLIPLRGIRDLREGVPDPQMADQDHRPRH